MMMKLNFTNSSKLTIACSILLSIAKVPAALQTQTHQRSVLHMEIETTT